MTQNEKILKSILETIEVRPYDLPAFQDAFSCIRNISEEKGEVQVKLIHNVRRKLAKLKTEEAQELIFRMMCYTAPECFDDFMLYIEHKRKPQEQFWLPRRTKLLPIGNALQEMEGGTLDELFLSQPPRTGKALADDTPILTRNGWKNHGDLVVGDEVIGIDGKFKKVLAVHPKCTLDVMVEFTNGEKILCHENHEWYFYDRRAQHDVVMETKKIMERGIDVGVPNKRGHRYHFQVISRPKIDGEYKELPVDPYVLGVWLGDGTNTNPTIANPESDKAIIDRMVEHGANISWSTQHKTTGVWYYGFDIRKSLRDFDMCHSRRTSSKHIPEEYLTASYEQRLYLLAGLLDTDGVYIRKEKRYHFSTTEERLRDGVIQLVSTFGWRTCTTVEEPALSSSGIQGRKRVYTISFCPDVEIPCALERKQNHEFAVQRRIAVKSMTKVEPKQGNCITVEDGMYLAGNTMIPTHNSTLMMFYFTWIMGRNSERSNLYCSYTDSVVGAMYTGIMEILTDTTTYAYYDVFNSKIASTNAADLMLNLDRKKRYASFTGRSLYGTLNGACDCNGYLIADDLHSGIEEVLSPTRLKSAWDKVDNNLIPRAKQHAKIIWEGTRWSLSDCIQRRIDLLENDPNYARRRFKIVNIPALDENDQSNFDYDYGVGFDTDFYHQRRASFAFNDDMASWLAQYQGEPIEREGTVFNPSSLRYFNGVLPDADPDRIFMAVDPAYGGGDFTAATVIHQFGDDLYLSDVIFDDGEKNVTQPLIVSAIKKYGVQAVKIEGTKMTAAYGEEIEKTLKNEGIRINLQINTNHFTGNGKRQRIFDTAPEIREKMVFLSAGSRSKTYEKFMNNVFSFTIAGKQAKHDDAPDALAMSVKMAFSGSRKAEVMRRPF